MTKKEVIALADTVREYQEDQSRNGVAEKPPYLLDRLMDFCQENHPRFDKVRWLGYIRGECGPNGGKVRP